MKAEELLYRIGELVEYSLEKLKDSINPKPQEKPPTFRFLKKIVKSKVTVHELLVLKLQLAFILYLFVSLLIVIFLTNELYLVALTAIYFAYLRAIFRRYKGFFIEHKPYQVFYYSISALGFLAFFGYSLLKRFAVEMYYSLGYLVLIFAVVIIFRHYFRSKYGRDWTYGVVEEIKGDLVRIYVHDDIRANVKPGRYWVDRVPDLEIGRIVKVLVEERTFRSSVPVRIIEVYLSDQFSSSKASTEAKEESESNSSL